MSFPYTTINEGDLGVVRPNWMHSAQVLSGRIPLTRRLAAVAEFPFAVYSYDYPDAVRERPSPFLTAEEQARQFESHFGLGNPYLGVDARAAPGLALGGGIRLPLSRDRAGRQVNYAASSGVMAHVEQAEAYFVDMATLAFHARYESPPDDTPLTLRAHASPAVLYDLTEASQRVEGDRDRAQGTIAYGVQLFAAAGPARLGGGLVGRRYVLDPRDVVWAFNSTALRLEAVFDRLPVQPGLSARIPLSGVEFSDAIVNLSLTVPVR